MSHRRRLNLLQAKVFIITHHQFITHKSDEITRNCKKKTEIKSPITVFFFFQWQKKASRYGCHVTIYRRCRWCLTCERAARSSPPSGLRSRRCSGSLHFWLRTQSFPPAADKHQHKHTLWSTHSLGFVSFINIIGLSGKVLVHFSCETMWESVFESKEEPSFKIWTFWWSVLKRTDISFLHFNHLKKLFSL